MSAWGTGTRRLAALEISSLGISAEAISVIDEPETGLEPYRQRVFIRDLACHPRQAFLTTHSPAVLSQASKEASQTWRVSDPVLDPNPIVPIEGHEDDAPASHALFAVGGEELGIIASTQPEALFAKLPLVCEGVTEVGFITRMLEHRFGIGFSCRGFHCLDAGGHYKALPIAKALLAAGFAFAAVVDDEGKKSGSWERIGSAGIMLRWENGACLEVAILSALPDDLLQETHLWADRASNRNAIHQLAEIRQALELPKGMLVEEMFAQVGRQRYLADS